ncbi:MAG: GNAT family N-acetyltransferase [Ruminococcus sp.]|uniref:GNAT family N-acetyltransferase n=1 Tax=Ruminococcus sp. TaxID=41978 RepID=UPI0025E2D2ED|nr:GNAT family N-acetyltransferase [Ruminococcus sp.]MBR5683342.1 GNAT family N-acetyltransferase [Ruminococcus sp.]
MKSIDTKNYKKFIRCAESIEICRVFPLSVTEEYQSGSIYETVNCTIIRHRNNFTFLSGTPNDDEIQELHELILAEKLKFLCNDRTLCQKLADMGGIELIPRDFYSYPAETAPELHIPEGFSLRSIDRELFDSITGAVPPSLYWDSFGQFSRNGLGVCIMHGNEAAAWAFSSAVSSKEADIGIETAEAFQRRGLAYAAAAALIREILPSRRPTWTCQRSNHGSSRTAEKLGFVRSGEYLLIRPQ